MGIRRANEEHNVLLRVRKDGWGVQLDVHITPIYCVNCEQQLPGLYEHLGSRYGQVGTLKCNHCDFDIHCVDNDNIVEELRTSGYTLNYYSLYRQENETWKKIKETTGYDIISRHGGNTVLLTTITNEIAREYKITLKGNQSFTSHDGKITHFPNSITNWFELLNELNI
jgi:hypothetical protein